MQEQWYCVLAGAAAANFSWGGARQDNVFARNLRACFDNGLYVHALKDLHNVHARSVKCIIRCLMLERSYRAY